MDALPDPHKQDDPKARERTFRDPEGRMTFTEHLGELRTRIVRSGIAVVVGMLVCYIFSNQIIVALSAPLAQLQGMETIAVVQDDGTILELEQEVGQVDAKWVVLNPLESVLVKLKIAAYGGLLLCLPYVIFHICGFIFPGLTVKERHIARILIFGCAILAVAGVSVAYWGIFPMVMPYLTDFAPEFVDVQLRLNETMSLLLKGFAGFAVAFQFPMVVLILVYLGLLTPQTLREYRKIAWVTMFAVGMLLTPPDPLSMIMMALPLILLYEFSIWASYLVIRSKRANAEAS